MGQSSARAQNPAVVRSPINVSAKRRVESNATGKTQLLLNGGFPHYAKHNCPGGRQRLPHWVLLHSFPFLSIAFNCRFLGALLRPLPRGGGEAASG